ncbi:MAG TPA: AsmA family protein [Pseudomonadales bacterium]|nr:AsmA family protein [Pseudomonadales bacterium]
MIRWIFKWVLRLALLAVVLFIILLLSLNSIIRIVMEHNIRSQTGMDAEIGRVELGLTKPTLEIQNLKIYNPQSFGGTPFLDIPEIHVEYDRVALAEKEIHVTLLRFNLGELDFVRNENGQLNIDAMAKTPKTKSHGTATPNFKKETGYDFKQIDMLNVSFHTVKYIDLKNPANNREQIIGLQNCVVPNVKSPNDLAGLAFLIGLRSNHFFDPLLAHPQDSNTLQSILNLFGVMM